MRKILDKRNMTEQDWQDYRSQQKGIGGSEVASILGVQPPYAKSKFVLWLEKTGRKDPDKLDNEYIEWGNILEPVVRKQFAKKTGFKVFQNNFVLQHDNHDFMIANIDGEVLDPTRNGRGVLEIKTTSEWNKKEWEGDHVPVAYMAQIQHYLAVTGYEYAYVAVLIGGNKLRYWSIDRDDFVIDQIIDAEKNFMKIVDEEIEPEIGGTQSESDYLAAAYPNGTEEELSMPEPLEKLAKEFHDLQGETKVLEARMKEIKNKIRLEAKEIGKLKGYSLVINMPTISKTLFDSKAFAADHEDLYNKYKTKTSTYRDFKIKMLEVK